MSKEFSLEEFVDNIDDFTDFDATYGDIKVDPKLPNDRRFSFSEPLSPPLPPMPPSPKLKPVMSIKIPQVLPNPPPLESLSDEEDTDAPIQLDFPKNLLLTLKHSSKDILKIPPRTSYDAYKIWKKAGISTIAPVNYVELKLLDWALKYAKLEIVDKTIKSIAWISSSGSICTSSWKGFLRWIMCACSNNIGANGSSHNL